MQPILQERWSNNDFTLFQQSIEFWFALEIGSMLTVFHASTRHSSSLEVHLIWGSAGTRVFAAFLMQPVLRTHLHLQHLVPQVDQ